MTDKNLIVFRGEQFKLENYTIQDPDGNNIDLTGNNINGVKLVVATHLAQFGETKFEKDGSDLSVDGNVDFTIDPSDTENLTTGNYLYEIFVDYQNSENYVAEVGRFYIKPRADR